AGGALAGRDGGVRRGGGGDKLLSNPGKHRHRGDGTADPHGVALPAAAPGRGDDTGTGACRSSRGRWSRQSAHASGGRMISVMVKVSAAWFVAILAGMPLYVSLGLAALAVLWFAVMPVTVLPQTMAGAANSFPIVAAPLFIRMGNILAAARITDRIVEFASAVIGWVRGGYAHASILTSMVFAGMVGSAVADAAGSGAIEVRA